MAQSSRPDPAVSSGALTEAEWERVAVRYSDDGVYGDPTDPAYIVAGVGLNVTVKAEKRGSLRGIDWYAGTTDTTLSIASNSSGQTRIDRVVLRLDRSNWTVRAVVRQGTAGSGAPALQQDTGGSGLYEIPLARVTVANAASSVTVQRDELWVGSRIRPCTAATRPSPVKRGDVVHETDTGKWMGWNGTTWVSLYEYTGKLALGAGYSAWDHYATNFAARDGNLVSGRVAVRRVSGGTFGASDPDGSYIAALPTAVRPQDGATHHFTGIFTNEALCRVEIRPDGQIWVKNNTKDVPINAALVLTFTFPIGA